MPSFSHCFEYNLCGKHWVFFPFVQEIPLSRGLYLFINFQTSLEIPFGKPKFCHCLRLKKTFIARYTVQHFQKFSNFYLWEDFVILGVGGLHTKNFIARLYENFFPISRNISTCESTSFLHRRLTLILPPILGGEYKIRQLSARKDVPLLTIFWMIRPVLLHCLKAPSSTLLCTSNSSKWLLHHGYSPKWIWNFFFFFK